MLWNRRNLIDPQESQEREESIRDDILGDKINRAKQRQNNRDGSNGDTKTDSRKQRDEDKVIPDDSSLCEEFDKDPLGRSILGTSKTSLWAAVFWTRKSILSGRFPILVNALKKWILWSSSALNTCQKLCLNVNYKSCRFIHYYWISIHQNRADRSGF